MKFSVPKAIDTDPCDSTVVIHNALVIELFWEMGWTVPSLLVGLK